MSWSYAGGAECAEDFFDVSDGGYGPWAVDVAGERLVPLLTPVGSQIRYELDGLSGQPYMTVTAEDGSIVAEGIAEYNDDGVMSGPTGEANVRVVASLAQYTHAQPEVSDAWHLYGLSVIGDPQDAGVIGAQGGG